MQCLLRSEELFKRERLGETVKNRGFTIED
jgi:hypothetical protein